MKKYKGSCHCGEVEYEVRGEFAEGMQCNCSLCKRAGWTLLFVPETEFSLTRGEDRLVDYQFGDRNTHHPFCKACGVRSFGYGRAPDGSKMYSVNARCLVDFDLASLSIHNYDGASL